MSTKRTSTESSHDEQTSEDSDVLQQEDNAKRGNFAALSDTTLQDLPIELLECILIKVIVMEVKDLKLAKSVWKEKADHVINRLGTVCLQWTSIFSTDLFRDELHTILDNISQKTIRLEILQQSHIRVYPTSVTTMKDDVFVLYNVSSSSFAINCYDRNNVTKVRDAIQIPTSYPPTILACPIANCVYALTRPKRLSYSILKFSRNMANKFVGSAFNSDMTLTVPRMAVTYEGNFLLSYQDASRLHTGLNTYRMDGALVTRITIRAQHISRGISHMIPKSNGNLVLVSVSDAAQAVLTEIDADGVVLRQCQSTIGPFYYSCKADLFGRLIVASGLNKAEIFDSENNLLESLMPQIGEKEVDYYADLAFNCDRNEIAAVVSDSKAKNGLLTFIRLLEEQASL